MGMDYSAAIVVGLPAEEMSEYQDDEGYWDEDGYLEFHSDSYDSRTGIVGIEIKRTPSYSYCEFSADNDFLQEVKDALDYFKELCNGLEAKVYLTTRGY